MCRKELPSNAPHLAAGWFQSGLFATARRAYVRRSFRGQLPRHAPFMRTQLGTYCQQFDGTLRPVVQDLESALKALQAVSERTPGKSLETPLRELQHQLRALCDKVAEQQAYVLIFGPLKSGKSTLMNAIAASYVSEVSSLPAYPCLVFVRAGDARRYVVTCYDGETRSHTDPKALHEDIAEAHTQLAEAIRQAEDRGLTFDPQEHFQGAIRRVDVHVPDSELRKSGAVLVDTPGLYTRMRFGYDRMTRDFRDAAACAIFVVKSDTLFLEQVFSEFQQLLDLFSRIFLVVNVDAQKRDVGPDGRLLPSLEQSRPSEVLKAFEQLAMSAPLRKAAEDGRVQMYPVDLLHAASDRMSKEGANKAQTGSTPTGFETFEKDLTTYLASNEYLSAFLRDSLQRADGLLGELLTCFEGGQTKRLEQQISELVDEQQYYRDEIQRVEQTLKLDWTEAFARSRRDIDAELERAARDRGSKLVRSLGASIDTWFLSNQSLHWLVHDHWSPLIKDYREAVLEAGRQVFAQASSQSNAGLDLPNGVGDLARRAGIDLRSLRQTALQQLGKVRWKQAPAVAVDVDSIPIRKRLLERISFRSMASVRARIFGAPDKLDVKLPGREKAKSLGEPGRLHLHQCVAQFRGQLLPQTTEALSEHFGDRFEEAAAKLLREQLNAYLPTLRDKLEKLCAQHTYLEDVASPLRSILAVSDGTRAKLKALGDSFRNEVATDAPTKSVVLEPQAPPKAATRKPDPHRAHQHNG